MKEELISIIMPAFNAEKTIGAAIRSVFAQTYGKWELIVIDDGSTDNTLGIVSSLSDLDKQIVVLRNQYNLGVSASRNFGISHAKGEWIAFLDSDDMWLPEKLEKQVEIISKDDSVDFVYTGSMFINTSGNLSAYHLKVPQKISYKELLKQNVVSCSSVLIRRELIKRYPMKRGDIHEDYAVWLQCLRDGYHVYGINEPLLIYRLSETSRSGNKRKSAIMTYRVYRFMDLNIIQALYYLGWYGYRNLKKYYFINNR